MRGKTRDALVCTRQGWRVREFRSIRLSTVTGGEANREQAWVTRFQVRRGGDGLKSAAHGKLRYARQNCPALSRHAGWRAAAIGGFNAAQVGTEETIRTACQKSSLWAGTRKCRSEVKIAN